MGKSLKYIYKKNWKQKMMTWLLMWPNVNVPTLNATLQLLVILVVNPCYARELTYL